MQSSDCFTKRVCHSLCSAFRHTWITPQGTWTSRPAAVYCHLLAARTAWLRFLDRNNTSIFVDRMVDRCVRVRKYKCDGNERLPSAAIKYLTSPLLQVHNKNGRRNSFRHHSILLFNEKKLEFRPRGLVATQLLSEAQLGGKVSRQSICDFEKNELERWKSIFSLDFSGVPAWGNYTEAEVSTVFDAVLFSNHLQQ